MVSVTLRPLIADCTGVIFFTDLQLQEGDRLTGYMPHTTTMLKTHQILRATITAWFATATPLSFSISAESLTGLLTLTMAVPHRG